MIVEIFNNLKKNVTVMFTPGVQGPNITLLAIFFNKKYLICARERQSSQSVMGHECNSLVPLQNLLDGSVRQYTDVQLLHCSNKEEL